MNTLILSLMLFSATSDTKVATVLEYFESDSKVEAINIGVIGVLAYDANCDFALYRSVEDARTMDTFSSIHLFLKEGDIDNAKNHLWSYRYVYGDITLNKKSRRLEVLNAKIGGVEGKDEAVFKTYCERYKNQSEYTNARISDIFLMPNKYDNRKLRILGVFGKYNNSYGIFIDANSASNEIRSNGLVIADSEFINRNQKNGSLKEFLGRYVSIEGLVQIPVIGEKKVTSWKSVVKKVGAIHLEE